MTKKFYNTMMRFCFSERDSENIDAAESEEKSKVKKNKESNFYVPIEHKDDVEKMKVWIMIIAMIKMNVFFFKYFCQQYCIEKY